VYTEQSSELPDGLQDRERARLKIHFEPLLMEPGRCNRVSRQIHLEALIKQVWRYAVGGDDHVILEALIERVWRGTWRP